MPTSYNAVNKFVIEKINMMLNISRKFYLLIGLNTKILSSIYIHALNLCVQAKNHRSETMAAGMFICVRRNGYHSNQRYNFIDITLGIPEEYCGHSNFFFFFVISVNRTLDPTPHNPYASQYYHCITRILAPFRLFQLKIIV